MEDLFRAGGLLAVLQQIQDLLDPTAITVTGGTLVGAVDRPSGLGCRRHHPQGPALQADASIAVLRGNLAPRGAIIKPAAASPELLVHRGTGRRLRLDRGSARAH